MRRGGGKPQIAEAASTVPRAACVGGLHPPYRGSAVRATLARPQSMTGCRRSMERASRARSGPGNQRNGKKEPS